MSNNVRVSLMIVAGAIAAFLLCWLVWTIVSTVGPLLGSAIVSAVNFVLSAITWLVTAAVGLFMGILAIAVPIGVGVACVWILLKAINGVIASINEIGRKIENLGAQISRDVRDTAIDAGFLAFAGLLAGCVYWVATGDFVERKEEAEIIKTLAVGAVFCTAAKLLLMIPVRRIKVVAIAIFLIGVAAVITYLVVHYNLPHDLRAVATAVAEHLTKASLAMVVALSVIMLLFLTSLLYPFSPERWKKIVW